MPLDNDLFNGLAREKRFIFLTDEMARRVGMTNDEGRAFLAAERVAARNARRPVDILAVARAISAAAKTKDAE